MAKVSEALPIGFKNLLIEMRILFLNPGKKGGAKIKTDGGVIVDDIEDLPLAINDSSIGIWSIALKGDPVIPIMKGMSTLFSFNFLKPRILSRRLIEMTMNGYKGVFHLLSIYII